MAASIDLKLNRDLIFPNFEGYKLSLDKLPSYKTGIEDDQVKVGERDTMELRPNEHLINKHFAGYLLRLDKSVVRSTIIDGLYKVELGDDQFSYHHAKLFGVHNHLTIDPWRSSSVYYIDSNWNVIKADAHDTSISCGPALWKIPDASNQQLVPGRAQATLRLVAGDLAVVCDGAGQVYIVDTGSRGEGDEKWNMLFSKIVPEDRTPCLLVDAVERTGSGENHSLECLLVHVTEAMPEEKDKYRSQYLTVLEWAIFSSVDRKSWSLERSRQLISRKPFSYASLGPGDGCLTVAGEANVVFTRDSEIPVVSDEEKEVENTDKAAPEYTWHQTLEDVTVQFTVPPGVVKADIYLTLRPDRLDFGVKNTRDLLKGQLHAAVDTDCSTWTIEGQRVDLCLTKQNEAMWPVVVEGDSRGEMLADPTEAAIIHERLAHLTSDEWNPDPTRSDKPYNTQELEDCDMFPDDNFQLARVDGDSHKLTHKTNLGSHQWLFNTVRGSSDPPGLCLRHDVDGLLWKPSSDSQWTHDATFNAFGYVQASKSQRKFTASSPDSSYVVICDSSRHLYLYRQSTPVERGESLRNRKTGQQVKAVAQQQVISLDTLDEVMGLQATNDRLYVATNSKLFMVKV